LPPDYPTTRPNARLRGNIAINSAFTFPELGSLLYNILLHRRFHADLALAFCSLLWGVAFVLVRSALTDASVFVYMTARFGVAAILMALIYRSELRRMSAPELFAGIQIGLLMFFGFAFQTAGLLSTLPSNAAFITGFGVVLIPVFLAVFWRRSIGAWVWAGALAAFGGLYLLGVPASGITGLHRGDLLVLICSVIFAFHVILISKYSSRFSVGALSLLQVVTTAIFSLAAVPFASRIGLEIPRLTITLRLAGAVFVTAALSTAVAFSVQIWAQRYTTASHTALILTLEPVFAAITSYLVLGERLGARALTGAGFILAGIVLAELKGPIQTSADSGASFQPSGPTG
jgi:drug/metabolite transporter (DMT)-like permease